MKITLSCADIMTPLKRVVGVVERRQTLPILANLLLRIEEGVLSLTGTDLEVELTARLPLSAVDFNLSTTLPARKLMDICRNLNDSIQLVFEEKRVVLKAHRSRFTLITLPAEDFPLMDEGIPEATFSLAHQEMKFLLERTTFAVAQQDVRHFLNGLLLVVEQGRLTAVATDGHRLALAKVGLNSVECNNKVILPRKGAVELQRLLSDYEGEVTLALGDNYLRVTTTDFTFTSKLIEGQFPDFQRVIPKEGDKTVYIARLTFMEMLRRAAILSNEKMHGVRLQLRTNVLRVLASNSEQETVEDEMEVLYQGKDGLDIAFNVNYLMDVTQCISSAQIKLILSDSNSSALIEEVVENESRVGDALYVVMPMRL